MSEPDELNLGKLKPHLKKRAMPLYQRKHIKRLSAKQARLANEFLACLTSKTDKLQG